MPRALPQWPVLLCCCQVSFFFSVGAPSLLMQQVRLVGKVEQSLHGVEYIGRVPRRGAVDCLHQIGAHFAGSLRVVFSSMNCGPVPRPAGCVELPAAFQYEALDLPQVLCHVLALDVCPHLVECHYGGACYLQQVLRRFQWIWWWWRPTARW